ncbi:MAG: hypothetical protein LBV54_05340 [Puniceicoccales bacterium]|jgi:hypothetical protein|nr:hypothetical protein [Puniceicoccales bacterium]
MKFAHLPFVALFAAFACATPASAQTKAVPGPNKITAAKPKEAPARPDVASTWLKAVKKFDGKAVATFVSDVNPVGLFAADAPCVVVRITTATQGDKAGGTILLLLPVAEVEKTIQELTPGVAARKTNFGAKRVLRRLDATFRVINGEAVLEKGCAPEALAKLAGKPSEILAAQLKTEAEQKQAEAKKE